MEREVNSSAIDIYDGFKYHFYRYNSPYDPDDPKRASSIVSNLGQYGLYLSYDVDPDGENTETTSIEINPNSTSLVSMSDNMKTAFRTALGITDIDLTGYATQSWVTSQGYEVALDTSTYEAEIDAIFAA